MARKKTKKYIPLDNKPLLCSIELEVENQSNGIEYPFCVPIIRNTKSIVFDKQVTFFVGENGSGKSTLLEGIASAIGFGPEGGSKNIHFTTTLSESAALAACMKLVWTYKPHDGYFFRAESFFNVASYLDSINGNNPYGNKSLHQQSHGESFFSFFSNRLDTSGIYILDEPEAALSPQRQLALLRIIYDLTKCNAAQFIIATHSPILLAFPDAVIYTCDNHHLREISYTDTDHYQITKSFLDAPSVYLKNLFADV